MNIECLAAQTTLVLERTMVMVKEAFMYYDIFSVPTFQSFQHDQIHFTLERLFVASVISSSAL